MNTLVNRLKSHVDMPATIRAVLSKFGGDAEAINEGRCSDFADAVADRLGGELNVPGFRIGTVADPHGGRHWYISYAGRAYDAEAPNGVSGPNQLPIILRHRNVKKGQSVKTPSPLPLAAGLAVVASDTGRVLMLQRPLDGDDPNAGKWEFPGGQLEGVEQPVDAAFREWEEETGLDWPYESDGPAWDRSWQSTDGKYVGFVTYIPSESELDLNDRDLSSDPDSEAWAVLAWIHPRDLPQHNLRPALLTDVDEVLAKITKWLLGQVRKQYGPVNRLLRKESFFESCERDEQGRCKPGTGGGSGGKMESSGLSGKAQEAFSSLAKAGAALAAKANPQVKAKIDAIVQSVPESVRAPLGNAYHVVHAALMVVNDSSRALALEVARGKGLNEEQVGKLARTLSTIDLTFQGTAMATAVATAALAPPVALAAKAASYVPVATMGYLLNETRSKEGLVNLAKSAWKLLKEKFPGKVKDAVQSAWGAVRHPLTAQGHKSITKAAEEKLSRKELAQFVADAYVKSGESDFWLAAFSVAFDEVHDVEQAVAMANEVTSNRRQQTKSVLPTNRLKASYFETCDRDKEGHCLPSGEGGDSGAADKPSKPEAEKPKRAAPGSQLKSEQRDQLRAAGMVGTFPPADVPLEAIKINPKPDKFTALMQWDQKTKSGRISRQYRYTQEFIDRNAAQKFERVMSIEPHLEEIGKGLTERMQDTSLSQKDREAAAIANAIRETGLRPTDGADSVKHGHYGISSLQARHVKIKGSEVHLDFIGKEGVRNRTILRDATNVAFFKEALKGKGSKDFLFQKASSNDAGNLLKELSKAVGGPEDIKVKDLRTVKATQTARQVVSSFKGPPPPLSGNTKKDAKLVASAILKISGEVAKVLNNTPTQARDNYIHPEIWKQWQSKLQNAS